MINSEFNMLFVDVQEFVLGEMVDITTTMNIGEQWDYFRSKTDEYLDLRAALIRVKQSLPSDSSHLLSIDGIFADLTTTFEKYKARSVIVREYLEELHTNTSKTTFSEKLFRFESLFLVNPIISIGETEIQQVMEYAKKYVSSTTKYYYYTNNPFVISPELNVVIPKKFVFDRDVDLLKQLYAYMVELVRIHKKTHEDQLSTLPQTAKDLSGLILELQEYHSELMKHSLKPENFIDATLFYDQVNILYTGFESKKKQILDSGIVRFSNLNIQFEKISSDITSLLDSYRNTELYASKKLVLKFDVLLDTFRKYVGLVESGVINTSNSFIIADTNLKDLSDQLVELSVLTKQSIAYTQKFHKTGVPTELTFEYYQTTSFVDSIKEYYYDLVVGEVSRITTYSLDDFGDKTIDVMRADLKKKLTQYNQFIDAEFDFFTEHEVTKHIETVNELQNSVKISAVKFYTAAKNISFNIPEASVEAHYARFLEKLKLDLSKFSKISKSSKLDEKSVEYVDAFKKIIHIKEILNNTATLLSKSKEYVVLGYTDFIQEKINIPMKAHYELLQRHFISGNYLVVLDEYSTFYNARKIDFNLAYAFFTLADLVSKLMDHAYVATTMHIDEYTDEKSSIESDKINALKGLFDDATYKVLRNELFVRIDALYDYITQIKPNESGFLIHEKNAKKVLVDSILLKLDYMVWFHRIIQCRELFDKVQCKDILLGSEIYKKKEVQVKEFFKKLEVLTILVNSQNKNIAMIERMISENGGDSGYELPQNIVNIATIDNFNGEIGIEFQDVASSILWFEKLAEIAKLNLREKEMIVDRSLYWKKLISEVTVNDSDIKYDDSIQVLSGVAPFSVRLKASVETYINRDGELAEPEFIWRIGGESISGKTTNHTFYEAGEFDVKCEAKYENGDIFTKSIKFKLTPRKYGDSIRVGELTFKPLQTRVDIPKLTYLEPTDGKLITVPIKIFGNVQQNIKNGLLPLKSMTSVEYSACTNDDPYLGSDHTPHYVTKTKNYTIMNFSSLKSYTVTVNKGTVNRTIDVIALSAPDKAGEIVITIVVNGVPFEFPVQIYTSAVIKPINLSPTNGMPDVGNMPLLKCSEFFVLGNVEDTHKESKWDIFMDGDVIHTSGWTNTALTSYAVPINVVQPQKTYTWSVMHRGFKLPESQPSTPSEFNTAENFGGYIGISGKLGFGVGVYPGQLPNGIKELNGTKSVSSENYGNYVFSDGSIMVFVPKFYYRIGSEASPNFKEYGCNAIDILWASSFTDEHEANANGYALHRAFKDGGKIKYGFFIDKYVASKHPDNNDSVISIKNAYPLQLENPDSNGLFGTGSYEGCTGTLTDSIILARKRGEGVFNVATIFMYDALAKISLSHGQSAKDNIACAWFDAEKTTNYPKGHSRNGVNVEDPSVTFVMSNGADGQRKPRGTTTGNVAKTTHNGQSSGVVDISGLCYEVMIGLTSIGLFANSYDESVNGGYLDDRIELFYTPNNNSVNGGNGDDKIFLRHACVLKSRVSFASLTESWGTDTGAFGSPSSLAFNYDIIGDFFDIDMDIHYRWLEYTRRIGSDGSNQVFSSDVSGIDYIRSCCGVVTKDSLSATGTNMFGNDTYGTGFSDNVIPVKMDGVFGRDFSYNCWSSSDRCGFRVAMYGPEGNYWVDEKVDTFEYWDMHPYWEV